MIKKKSQGQLIVISGPSAVGKGSICKELLKVRNDIWLSISTTTREPREREIEGVSYYFISKEEFIEKIKKEEFLEHVIGYNDQYYGTSKEHVLKKLNQGIDVILEIEIIGALKIKELYKDAIFIFVMPPSMKELRRRLITRKTEDEKTMEERFKKAYQEINEISKYNYVVVNDLEKDAVFKINAIITAEKCRVDRIEEVYLNTSEEVMHETLVKSDN